MKLHEGRNEKSKERWSSQIWIRRARLGELACEQKRGRR